MNRVFNSILISALMVMLNACTNLGTSYSVNNLAPLQLNGETISPWQVLTEEKRPDILSITPAMTAYFDRYMLNSESAEQRARILRNTLLSPAFLDIEFEFSGNLTASEIFERRRGNCISFANLYIALARHYGLDANYQLQERYPRWSKEGNLIYMEIHVNVIVKFSHGTPLVVDNEPQTSDSDEFYYVAEPKLVKDKVAESLFYSNLGIDAFAGGNFKQAYQMYVLSINSSPDKYFVWSNIGPLFRSNLQFQAAEQAYLIALDINPGSYTVLNNLAVLYQQMEQPEKYQFYLAESISMRNKNPYFYFQLALASNGVGDYQQALEHVRRAIKLKNNEILFYDLLEQLYRQMGRVVVN